jgi:glycosyltransferase involved in cell wall biosynthesis
LPRAATARSETRRAGLLRVGGRRARLLVVVNDSAFFLSHRLPIALAAREAGAEVHVATGPGEAGARITALGFPFHPLPISRRGVGIAAEARTILAMARLYRTIRPDLVHHVTIKPVIYGSIAARWTRVPHVVNAISGLGYVFASRGPKAAVLRAFVRPLYRQAFRHPSSRAIFQNPDDRDRLLADGLLRREATVLIRGSGVDPVRFGARPEPEGLPVVVLASRMLWHKGVGEFVEAARSLRDLGVSARFVLAGDTDPGNPTAIPRKQLEAWHAEGVIEWWGHCDDMPTIFARSHIVCLPSVREGVPKVLLEAASCGRAIVTTDTPGCREIVRHGENGLLVGVRDVSGLADAILRLTEAPELRRRMGARGRMIAESEFSVDRVVAETLDVYRELLD